MNNFQGANIAGLLQPGHISSQESPQTSSIAIHPAPPDRTQAGTQCLIHIIKIAKQQCPLFAENEYKP